MKKLAKILVLLLTVVLIGIVGILSYVSFALPDVGPPPEISIKPNAASIENGRYLANHVAVCIDCHSTRDYTLFAAPPIAGTEGKGGETFDHRLGFPGSYTAKNITPSGIGNWTDGEIYRAMTTGVSKDGHALFPIMPYPYYASMDPQDANDIIAYIRTLKPLDNTPPSSTSDFPMNFIINTIPQKAKAMSKPSENDILKYGEYLITVASCRECHTKPDGKGGKVPEMDYAGGFEFPMPGFGKLVSPNITPDNETGIGKWTKEAFVARFKAYSDSTYQSQKVEKGQFQTMMPWTMYSGMKVKDLEAIYTYLKSIKPVKNKVVKFTSEI
ncbi:MULTISPECIES: c-type cytochrome [Bacteroidota]|uniref:Cytochrome c n=1 Tax=Flectobacillus rivi TaxID=2984209 RepID=A0ABT6YZT9_9BACT|nr:MULTISPECIES: cytochrome c [Bacteroidota]MDI9874385.1 cytochrome c [Flectobacillus rivi]NBB26724.1 c-type cytochrome [Cellulophaga sp. BC115SP]